MTTAFVERVRYSASGVGLAGGGSIPNVLAVKQVRRRHPLRVKAADIAIDSDCRATCAFWAGIRRITVRETRS